MFTALGCNPGSSELLCHCRKELQKPSEILSENSLSSFKLNDMKQTFLTKHLANYKILTFPKWKGPVGFPNFTSSSQFKKLLY